MRFSRCKSSFSAGFTPSLENADAAGSSQLSSHREPRRFPPAQSKVSVRRKPSAFFSAGFTVMEALIAAAILGLAALGPIAVAHRSLVSSNEARDLLVASYLAQEAIEYVRNIRDQIQLANDVNGNSSNNGNNSGNWLHLLENCPSGSPCGVDVTETEEVSDSFPSCSSTNDCRIMFNTNLGYYGHQTGGSWQTTKFKRKVVITETVNDQEAYVTVVVEWPSRSVGTRQFTVETRLFKVDY